MRCAVSNCGNTSDCKGGPMTYFSFPSDPSLRKKWIDFCCRKEQFNPRTSFICMEHFRPEDIANKLEYEMGFAIRRLLNRGALPSIRTRSEEEEKLYRERQEREEKRRNKKTVQRLLKEYDKDFASDESSNSESSDSESSNSESSHSERNNSETASNPDSEVSIEIEPMVEFCEDVLPPCSNIVDGNDEVEQLKRELKLVRGENENLKMENEQLVSELKELSEKMEEDSRTSEFNISYFRTQLEKAYSEVKNLEDKLLTIFSKGQVEKLKGNKRPYWTNEDYVQSIILYAESEKLYELLYRKDFPIPDVSTLQKKAKNIDISKILSAAKDLSAGKH